ncbi:phosphoribosyltransferase domain-containing protein [Sphingomonas sp.]|uniref:phosphoribosyltransferase domain-containing protein n=1 Tax=Sphingomonas sp. TaxID=28214 RepID=UPI0025D5D114|nr:phosphoribosyltransferase domain-containing protein [Sphingomonas sp.]
MTTPCDAMRPRHLPLPIIDRVTTVLPTGSLTLTVLDGPEASGLLDVGARANPKRGFLIVSKVLGRHLPTRPRVMRDVMARLAAMIPSDAQEPIVFLGMAETATALGQGVFEAHRRLYPQARTIYLQSSRQRANDVTLFASFEEGHSHATTHLVQIRDAVIQQEVVAARTLVLVDDECSTGRTFEAAAEALMGRMPDLMAIHTCTITDWAGDEVVQTGLIPVARHSVLRGCMEWRTSADQAMAQIAPSSNRPGLAPVAGMHSRSGLRYRQPAERCLPEVSPGERILVLGDGEHSYEALLVAEELEDAGCIAAVQCITRSPAVVGHALRTKSGFRDAYGSGAPCFLYNILEHRPDRILLVVEIEGSQVEDTRAALADLGVSVPIELVLCTYPTAMEGVE